MLFMFLINKLNKDIPKLNNKQTQNKYFFFPGGSGSDTKNTILIILIFIFILSFFFNISLKAFAS